MSIEIEKLSDVITDIIKDYSVDVKQELIKTLDVTAIKILDYVRNNCPKSSYGSNHLADTFVITEIGSDEKKTIYISSQTKGRLVHLIELGFKHRSGKIISARPFMRPAFDEFSPAMLEDIKQIIKNGG